MQSWAQIFLNLDTGKGGFEGVNYSIHDKLFLQAEPIFIYMILSGYGDVKNHERVSKSWRSEHSFGKKTGVFQRGKR